MPLEEAIEFYRDLESIEDPLVRRKARRKLGKEDLFYLGAYILGRRDLIHEWLYERIREVEAAPDGHIDLWAREHYKSTIITFILTIQNILNDPETTIGIFSHTRDIAKAFLRQIKTELTNNIELKALYDDVLWENPKTQAPKWSENDGLVVKRKSNPKEATVEAWGLVDGMPTGRHFKTRIYDDVVTLASVNTPEQIAKTTMAYRLSNNLGTEGGIVRVTGTRYFLFDTYREMLDEGLLTPRIYPATSDGSFDTTKSVLISPEALEEKRRQQGPYIFGAQMLLDPTADRVQGFKEEWLEYWPATSTSNLNVIILVDPANSKKKTADYTTMWVIGLGGDENYYVLDMVRDRLNLSERTNKIFDLWRQWRPLCAFYEEYGALSDVAHINDIGKRDNFRIRIQSVSSPLKKPDRIKALVPLFEQRRIYLPTSVIYHDYEGKAVNLVKIFKEEEYMAYPVLAHDDMLDALGFLNYPEVKAIPFPIPKREKGWNAIAEYKRRERANRPLV